MQLEELKIHTANLTDQKLFYTEILRLEIIAESGNAVSFKVGKSVLKFEYRDAATPYHFAITIPANKEKEALSWLKERVDILKNDSNSIQEFKNWNAKAIYFYDADQNIVEFIARNNLKNDADEVFDQNLLLELSEIGLPTTNIKKEFELLNKITNMEVYDGNFERFCAIGTENGLIICIDKNLKNWFPTQDKAYSSDFSLLAKVERATFRIEYKNEVLKAERI
ncbi:VOC family protein [Leeuwenhoekiella marinoflava]|uniref:Catechol-2,3-dioxygenase n=2 Tax=Leeuwenhoekiella marinoflava TaxID=988 RepID=A0A4Q0PN99_9FLAO|nr:hypothetical protein [Leeuwenhoekiella marinoflava]RXG31901.1 catechol-2,3-dioxygenase [Leeuwenhoekiella marinoflava]SHE90960.1 Catechol-2,3-dioxygenase [Leeuwenhoekiella marinoflava DSM 3653]